MGQAGCLGEPWRLPQTRFATKGCKRRCGGVSFSSARNRASHDTVLPGHTPSKAKRHIATDKLNKYSLFLHTNRHLFSAQIFGRPVHPTSTQQAASERKRMRTSGRIRLMALQKFSNIPDIRRFRILDLQHRNSFGQVASCFIASICFLCSSERSMNLTCQPNGCELRRV